MNQYQFTNFNMKLLPNNPQFNQMMMMNNNMLLNQKQFACFPMINFINMPNYMNQNFNQNMIMMNNMYNNNLMMNMKMNMNNNQMTPNNLNMFQNNMNQFNSNGCQNNLQNKFGNMNNFNNQINNMNFGMNNMINMMNNMNINNNTPNFQNENQNYINTNSMLCMKCSKIFKGKESLFLSNDGLKDKILELIDNNTFVNLNKKKLSQVNNNPQMNKEYEKLLKEVDMIKNKLNSIFTQENLSKLIDQKELLNFFFLKEKECIQFINDNFNGNEILLNFTIGQIKEIFYTNPQINNIVQSVILKISQINIESIQSEEYLLALINSYFPGIEVPQFLINEPLKILKRILFYSERNNETLTYINNTNKRQLMPDSEKLILFFENIKKNKNLIFEGINPKYELFYFFIAMNYSIFKKSYFNNEFFIFIKINEEIIKKYISPNFNYSDIYKELNSMNERTRNYKLETTIYPIIEGEINNNKDIIFNIIASFYYLLFYEFKIPNNSNGILNIGDPYINLIFKNFVINLDRRLKRRIKVKNNFYELLKELYISDINDLIKKNLYPSKTEEFKFYAIEIIILNNPKTRVFYMNLREKFILSGCFSKLGTERDFTYFEKFIELVPFEENIFSNTITILVSGYTNEESNPIDNWKDFINYFKKETMFYHFNWPSSTIPKVFFTFWKCITQFKKATLRAEICGKILAYIIYSNTIFKNFQINLVGFSLGNHVIKHCIKELYNLNHNSGNINNPILLTKNENIYQINIKNIIFIAGATHLKKRYKWKNYINETIIDKCNNCHTDNDWVLKYLYRPAISKIPLGIEKVNINHENKNLIENYDFHKYGFGHLGYKMGLVAEIVSGPYIEI